MTQHRADIKYMENVFKSEEIREKVAEVINKTFWPVQETLEEFEDWQKLNYVTTTMPKNTVHIGQLKLFLSEYQFLIDAIDKNSSNVVVVYAGSAPSMHLPYLLEAFPNVKFILIDPNEHVLFYKNNIAHYNTDQKDILYLRANSEGRYGFNRRVRALINDKIEFVNIKKVNDADSFSTDESVKGKPIQSSDFAYNDKLAGIIKKQLANPNHRVIIIEDFFTDDVARMIAKVFDNNNKFYFFSDIRTSIWEMKNYILKINSGIKESDLPLGNRSAPNVTHAKNAAAYEELYPAEIDIIANAAMQYNWLRIMLPTLSMLKFRCPFISEREKKNIKFFAALEPYKTPLEISKNDKIDFISDFIAGKFRYMKPQKTCLQSFPGVTSTETRLYIAKDDIGRIIDYDIKEYEDKLFYWNFVQRQLGAHEHHHEDPSLGLDICGDCAILVQLFERYSKKHRQIDVNFEIKRLLNYIGRKLFSLENFHGRVHREPHNVNYAINSLVNHTIFTMLLPE